MWQEVCDLPYYTEPDLFYETRMRKGMHIGELRRYASSLLGKLDQELTVHDLKLAFLHRFPLPISLDGSEHMVTVKKYNGEWVLSCDCKVWIFDLYGRKCKHTEHVEKILGGGGDSE